jgi:hypothetical protein
MRAGAVSRQVKRLLKMAVATRLTKQQDIQIEEADLLPSLGPEKLSASSHPAGEALQPDSPYLCISVGAA